MSEQTVSDFLFGPCSMSLLTELALQSEYWEKVEAFILENESEDFERLSGKQQRWLCRIKHDLIERAGG